MAQWRDGRVAVGWLDRRFTGKLKASASARSDMRPWNEQFVVVVVVLQFGAAVPESILRRVENTIPTGSSANLRVLFMKDRRHRLSSLAHPST